MSKKISKEELFERFKKRHGDKFKYSLVIGDFDKSSVLNIICPIHGVFQQSADAHTKYGCVACTGRKKNTQTEIIEQFKKIHGDLYDYSKTVYVNDNTKIEIICEKHGSFFQAPSGHKRQKHGCPKCSHEKIGKRCKMANDVFIEKCKKHHGNEYDLSLVNYQNGSNKIEIICKVHGNILVNARSLMTGHGCPKCGTNVRADKCRLTKDEFIIRAVKEHGNFYNYDKIDYNGRGSTIEIICPFHGKFKQKAGDHLDGCGCKKCKTTRGERKIMNFLDRFNINYVYQYKIGKYKGTKHVFDFYLPNNKTIIEFNGAQHYYPIYNWNGDLGFENVKSQDKKKEEFCKERNIKLVVIPYTELKKIDNILMDLNLKRMRTLDGKKYNIAIGKGEGGKYSGELQFMMGNDHHAYYKLPIYVDGDIQILVFDQLKSEDEIIKGPYVDGHFPYCQVVTNQGVCLLSNNKTFTSEKKISDFYPTWEELNIAINEQGLLDIFFKK